jgi:CHASE1-domain containing sensor protein
VAVFLIVVLGIALSLILFVRVQGLEQASWQSEFSQRATAGATALQRSVQEHLEVLNGLRAVYTAAARPLTRTAFQELAKGLLQRHPGMQALGWVPRVAEADVDAYVAAAQQDRLGHFQLTEWTPQRHVVRAARRDVYYPMFYIEPLERHRAAVGFNLGSIPAYLEAMQKALSTEEAVASAWRALTQDTEEHFGLLLFMPIYTSGAPHGTFEERRVHLQGFTIVMLHLGILVDKALQGMGLGTMGLELADVTDAASRYLLALQLAASHTTSWTFLPRQSTQAEAIRARVHWETTFTVAGRKWSVLFHPLPEVWNPYAWQAWSILVGGLLVTLVCVGVCLLKGSG